VDRMSMRHSLEVRVPFLDHTVVEYVNTWPTSAKLRDGESKYLLKRMIVGLVPADTLERSKKGFGIPIRRWFRGGLAEYPPELLLSPSSRLLHWLDGAAVRAVLDAHQRGMRDFSKRIWALLVLEQWCRAYGL
jgi:asparagine synthase (glutamine-hydrolysing)